MENLLASPDCQVASVTSDPVGINSVHKTLCN
jgi:hypothetical protein